MDSSLIDYAVRSSLIDMLDKNVLVILRDGKKLVGMMRSFDQYSTIVLENASERKTHKNKYCDVKLGLYLIRGENIVLMGDLEGDSKESMTLVTQKELQEAIDEDKAEDEDEEEDQEQAARRKNPDDFDKLGY